MTEEERDALTAKVLATPEGRAWISDIEARLPFFAAELQQRIARMRRRWSTGAPDAR